MYGTKFIVVTDAERQKIDTNIDNPRVSREALDLWEGDLGFVHKYITDFYRRFKSNMKKYSKDSGKSLKTFSATNDNLNEISYSKHPENIPVLMFNWKKYFIAENLVAFLDEPKSARELALLFRRSPARICEILTELKKEGIINNFRVRSCDY